ncbi:hypothetical protein [Alloactinosynnema sp. L-07]|nr:hypothetical protein [Alloactinosynnema sp. L-07]
MPPSSRAGVVDRLWRPQRGRVEATAPPRCTGRHQARSTIEEH